MSYAKISTHQRPHLKLLTGTEYAPGNCVTDDDSAKIMPPKMRLADPSWHVKDGFGIIIGVGERIMVLWTVQHSILEVQVQQIKATSSKLNVTWQPELVADETLHPWTKITEILMKPVLPAV